MRYDSYSYLFPPRPDQAMSPQMLPMLEKQGYQCQVKKNGTNSVIAVSPTGEITAMTRHREAHKMWRPDPTKLTAFSRLAGKGWYVFVAELLHSKVEGIRDTNYVHDVLVHDGDYLVGRTQMERRALLLATFNFNELEEAYSHNIYDQYTWIARQFDSGFKALYDGLSNPEDEGLVLKKPKQPLAICAKEKSNNGGLLKVRKKHKNYSF